jgi:di/tricarboxylate transporter
MEELHFWYTIAVVGGMLVCLAFDVAETAVLIAGALFLLLFGGVINPHEAFSGFGNEGMLSVGFLFVVAGSLQATGVFSHVTSILFGEERGNPRGKLIRFLFPVAGLSAFINNTPLVAMLIPAVKSWCRRHRFPSSKLLLPMSYATLLGGVCTLIGTSTNLVVHGLLLERGLPGFSFFELGRVGLPVAIVGILSLSFVLHRLLPKHKEVREQLGESVREFVVEMKVEHEYPHIGKSIQDAGLRHLRGLFLFQIEREGTLVAPVAPTENIRVGDRLFFTGRPSLIVELQKTKGLHVVKDEVFDLKNYDSSEVRTYEVVISASSPLIGKTVRESNFRSAYGAVILAIHRSGERIDKKVGDIALMAGDTLLILADREFHSRWYHSKDFALVSESDNIPSKRRWQAYLSLAIAATMVTLVTAELLPMSVASGTAAIVLVLAGCITMRDALASVEWGVLLSIACALGIAKGLENAGVADVAASGIVHAGSMWGTVALLAAIYATSVLMTELVTNNASAAMLLPIGLSIATQIQEGYMPFVYAVTFGASMAFATPIGYQTNLMVQSPGGYRFIDYLKIGLPLHAIVGTAVISSIYIVFY